MAGSSGPGELGQVVGGADHCPFGLHFLDATQQELSEPSCLLDLSEYRLDDLLSESVSASPSRPLELGAHGLSERPADLPFDFGGVFGFSSCDVSVDTAIGQGLQVGFAQIATIGRRFLRPGAEIGLDAIDQSDELAVVAHARSEP